MEKVKMGFSKTISRAAAVGGVLGGFLGLASPVYAQADTWIPDYIQNILSAFGFAGGSGNPMPTIRSRLQWGLTILFVIVFIVAIVYSALAAIKFISSQGDSGKLEESKAAVKAILFGFAAMLIAIVGIFVVIWALGGGTDIETELVDPSW